MIFFRRLLKSALTFTAFFMMLTACSPQRQYAYDPIYDVGQKTTKVKSSTIAQKTTTTPTTVVKDTKTSVSKLNPSADALVAEAKKWIGTPYRYGGHSRSGTDCSGFIMEVFRAAVGIEVPRTSKEQHSSSTRIDKSKLEVGDLVFFATSGSSGGVSHVGLYIGDNNMIHASTSRGVMISGLSENYWVKNYHSSGRVAKFRSLTTASTAPVPVAAPKPTASTKPAPAPSKATTSTPQSRAAEVRAATKAKVKEGKKEVKKQAKTSAKRTPSVKNARATQIQTPPKTKVEVSHSDLDKILDL